MAHAGLFANQLVRHGAERLCGYLLGAIAYPKSIGGRSFRPPVPCLRRRLNKTALRNADTVNVF